MTTNTTGVQTAPSLDETYAPGPAAFEPLPLREAAILVLTRTGESLKATQIVALIHASHIAVTSRSRTPAQSINRDLHAALRRGDPRVLPGLRNGEFRARIAPSSGSTPAATTRDLSPAPQPRLAVEPLKDALEAAGGIYLIEASPASTGRAASSLVRTYHRSLARGWVALHDADEIVVRYLRTHPCMVWGMGWWDALEDERHEAIPSAAR